jgi:hypothetical protein
MQDTRWDHALKVTGGGTGLVGHAGVVLLRKAADQAGLTAALSAALRKAGTSPLLDRGIVLVSMAAAIALGATSMSDIAVLAHLAPVLGAAPSGPTVRRALDLAGTPGMLDRIARARARARAQVWTLLQGTPAGSNTFTDHRDVLAAAIRQVPARFRARVLVRVDGAGRATSSSGTCCRCPPRAAACCSPAAG